MRGKPVFLRVARWEFFRFFKAKELIWGLIIILAIFLGQKIMAEKITGDRSTQRRIVVLGDGLLSPAVLEQENFSFEVSELDEEALRIAVREKEFDALMIVAGADSARLFVRKAASWQGELQGILTTARQVRLVAGSGVSQEFLTELGTPFWLETTLVEGGSGATKGAQVSVAIMIGLMLMGIFLGNSYLFVAITGEKTQRITEQIMAIISPQSWIDGKILGLAVLSLVHLTFNVLGYVLYRVVCVVVWGEALGLPSVLADPLLFGSSLLLVLLGFYFWFCFFGMVAATISDPNNSSRSSMLFLPMLPLGAAFAGLGNPDVFWIKLLALIPFSSPAVMPLRLVLGEVAWWEFTLSVALLVAGIVFLRKAAGTIFGLGMLMYGKEPGPGEMWRWLREEWRRN